MSPCKGWSGRDEMLALATQRVAPSETLQGGERHSPGHARQTASFTAKPGICIPCAMMTGQLQQRRLLRGGGLATAVHVRFQYHCICTLKRIHFEKLGLFVTFSSLPRIGRGGDCH